MNLFTGKYIIKVHVAPLTKAIELCLVVGVLIFQFTFYEVIELSKYEFDGKIVYTRGEDFVVRNNYLTLSFDRDDIEQDLKKKKSLFVKVVGFNIFDGIIKRRIINESGTE